MDQIRNHGTGVSVVVHPCSWHILFAKSFHCVDLQRFGLLPWGLDFEEETCTVRADKNPIRDTPLRRGIKLERHAPPGSGVVNNLLFQFRFSGHGWVVVVVASSG